MSESILQSTPEENAESRYVFFKVSFNNFRDVSRSTANAVTDREEMAECECVLHLPASYRDDGPETQLIISCHGAGGRVCEADGKIGGVSYVSRCVESGYAALDVCGSAPHGVTMGCPEHVFALYRAYLYAIRNYNLSRHVLVAGASMGGHTAMNFANTFPGIVTAIALIYPRLNINGVTVNDHYCLGTWDKTKVRDGVNTHDRIVQIYRFPDGNWCEENTIGFNPYKTRSYLDADGNRVVIPPCPIKVWQGLEDQTVDPMMTVEFVESVRRSNSYIELHLMEGVGHKISPAMREEVLLWFNRFAFM